MISLQHLHVLVTRPHPAGEELCKQIRQYGGEATHFPTIVFAPVDDAVGMKQVLEEIVFQDWLIFISPQAVYASIPMIRAAWPHFPPQLQIAAVGAGTAKALNQAGYRVAVYPEGEWSSEGLLDLSVFRNINGKKITLVRGVGGRETLEKMLLSRGAHVAHLIAYQRLLPTIDVRPFYHLFEQRKLDVVVITSCDGIKHYKILFGSTGWHYIKDTPVIVTSERIKKLAHDLDFKNIWVAKNASHEMILQTLAERRNELCQIKRMTSQ